MQYLTRFNVIGRSPFPMDMLRHDCCFPADTSSAITIGITHSRGHLDVPEPGTTYLPVTLVIRHNGNNPITNDRWSSFGWSVDPDSIVTERVL